MIIIKPSENRDIVVVVSGKDPNEAAVHGTRKIKVRAEVTLRSVNAPLQFERFLF